jgi:hypothetical protein
LAAHRLRRAAAPLRIGALLASLVAVLVACSASSSPPAPTPLDFGGLSHLLQQRGLTIVDVVSGDAGCSNTDLAKAAISFEASGLDQANPVKVYLYNFGSRDAFDRRSAEIGACAQAYVRDPAAYEWLGVSPYVVAGQGPWASHFRDQLRAGLVGGAGNGD